MPILPIQAAGALFAAKPLAEAAISGASAGFAGLLAALTPETPSAQGESSASALGLDGLPGGLAAPPAVSSAAKLRAETAALLQQFHSLFTSMLRDNDVAAGTGVRLESAADGSVRVSDNHPAAFRIEDLFTAHPALRQLFDDIVARAELLRSIEQPAGAELHSTPVGIAVDGERAALVSP